MTARNVKLVVAALLITIILGAGLLRRFSQDNAQLPKSVFINETSDHRFDESIQISILAAYKRTAVQNAVVITDRYSTEDIINKASAIFAKLSLGQQTRGRALLYIYSPKAHTLKIEVGYALEGVLPDAKVHFFEEAAKTFVYVDRYQDFWAELINTLNIEIFEHEHPALGSATPGFDESKFRFLSGGAGVYSQTYTASIEQLKQELKLAPVKDLPEYAPASTVEKSLQVYLKSLEMGIGDDSLPILSAESRLFRRFTPLTTYQLYRNWKAYLNSGIDRTIESGDLAFVFFKADHPVLPLVFSKEGGLWRIQEPMSWSLFQRFEDSMQVFVKFPIRSSSAELRQYLEKRFGKPLYPAPTVTLDVIGRDDAVRFLYFRLYFLEKAQAEIERDASLKNNTDMLYLALDMSNNLGQFSKSLSYMRTLVQLNPDDADLKGIVEFYEKAYVFDGPNWVKSGL